MSDQEKFNRNPKGKFAEEHAFSQVVFGSNSLLLEDDLNEMQAIQQQLVRPLYDLHGPDGWKSIPVFEVRVTQEQFHHVLSEFTVQVNGHLIRVAGVGNEGQYADVPETSNIISIGKTAHPDGENGLLFLEVREAVVGAADPIYRNGVQGAQQLANKLVDPRVGEETTRRLQLQSTMRIQNIASTTENASAMERAIDPEGGLYAYDQNGRWRSENNYWAIPLGVVRNVKPFKGLMYSTFYPFFESVNLTYNANGDVSEIITKLGDVEVSKAVVSFSSDRVYSVKFFKDGLETSYYASSFDGYNLKTINQWY